MTRLTLLVLSTLLLTSCTRGAGDMDVGSLQMKFLELQKQVDDMSSRLVEMDRRFADTAYFRPSSHGHQVVWVDTGFLYVQVKDLKAQKDGYQVTFEVGNPMSVTFRAVHATVSWGIPDLRGPAGSSDHAPAHHLDYELKGELRPGTITPVTMFLPDANGDDITSFSVRLNATAALMKR